MDDRKKHGSVMGAIDRMQDMVGGMAGKAAAATEGSRSAPAFVASAASGNRYEVEAAGIALRRGQSEAVRQFAQMMVDHHTSATHQLMSALRSSEVTRTDPELAMPAALQSRHSSMIDNLNQAADEDFDERYLEQQRLAHSENATLLSGYGESGDNPQLRSVARSSLPMVQRHAAVLERLGRH